MPPLAHEEGVGFFLARARAVEPDFEPDDAVPRSAGASTTCRSRSSSPPRASRRSRPKQILERLEQRLPLLTGGASDLPERQRTLRATIEWSYELLTPGRAAALRAARRLRAAAARSRPPRTVAEADLDTLQSLVDKSLVRHTRGPLLDARDDPRVRRRAARGVGRGRGACERRHAEYFLALAEEAEPGIRVYSSEWLDRLERENDNVRTALRQFETSGESEHALRLGGAVWWYWCFRNRHGEGRLHLEAALASDRRVTAARAKALVGGADMAVNAGDFETARRQAEEALALNRDSTSPRALPTPR